MKFPFKDFIETTGMSATKGKFTDDDDDDENINKNIGNKNNMSEAENRHQTVKSKDKITLSEVRTSKNRERIAWWEIVKKMLGMGMW